ncbi:PIN domain protein [uncultured Candidatus Thioglobus sp.]|nr:PIN domain protein [uncultured Candidatus Thioglobus sp.]
MVDSSVWIDYFNGQVSSEVVCLDNILGIKPIVIGNNILTEVLQGFRGDKEYKKAKHLLTSLPVLQLSDEFLAVKSAENYPLLRKGGITVRKTIDTIIATYCIEQNIPLLFSDKDFLPFIELLSLESTITKTLN